MCVRPHLPSTDFSAPYSVERDRACAKRSEPLPLTRLAGQKLGAQSDRLEKAQAATEIGGNFKWGRTEFQVGMNGETFFYKGTKRMF